MLKARKRKLLTQNSPEDESVDGKLGQIQTVWTETENSIVVKVSDFDFDNIRIFDVAIRDFKRSKNDEEVLFYGELVLAIVRTLLDI